MAQIEGGHVDERVGTVPGPDSVNRRVTGPGTEPGSVPGLVRLKWAMCKRGLRDNMLKRVVKRDVFEMIQFGGSEHSYSWMSELKSD